MRDAGPDGGSGSLPGPVLVTGAGGFIGSHLTEHCVEQGLEVRAFVHYNSGSRWGWLEQSSCRGDIEVVAGDIRDFDSVSRAMKGCRTVFHLAALIGIPYSYRSPQAYIRTNVEGTYNVLEAARSLALDRVVVTSTSETYGTAQYVPIDEEHPANAQSPYAATKVAADQLALSYHRSFELPVHIVRPFNTYGPRQSARAFIPTVATQILAGYRKIRLGTLSPTRDLTFVVDTARAFMAIAESDDLLGKPTNIGMGKEIAMGDLAARIVRIIGADVEITSESERIRPAASEVERLFCGSDRLRQHSSWEPGFSLDEGLERTITWIRENLDSYKPDRYST